MSPRRTNWRKLVEPPKIKGFKPYGPEINTLSEPVFLLFEEYEALKLCDYDQMNHHQASAVMNVSRPTFTRIYASARQKMATAFVEGRTISIEGGKVYFDSSWYLCESCRCHFNNPDATNTIECCPLCGSDKIRPAQEELDVCQSNNAEFDQCVCPKCGYEKQHQFGNPCAQEPCPNCNALMRRKRKP
jgi:predicted DNA-binding protein (UPF0251 family)